MNGAERLVMGQQDDQSLDLTPVAKMDMIAKIEAAVGTGGGFITGIRPEYRDQFRRILIALSTRKIW